MRATRTATSKRHSRRLWPQTEIAKAWIAQAEAGEAGAADEARAALSRLERHYLRHPVAGGWYDQFDREGQSMVCRPSRRRRFITCCAPASKPRGCCVRPSASAIHLRCPSRYSDCAGLSGCVKSRLVYAICSLPTIGPPTRCHIAILRAASESKYARGDGSDNRRLASVKHRKSKKAFEITRLIYGRLDFAKGGAGSSLLVRDSPAAGLFKHADFVTGPPRPD